MRKTRFSALLAGTALAGATFLGSAGIAAADDAEKPVRFKAEETGQCEVTFTIENETNSDYYRVDYQINGEFEDWAKKKHEGLDDENETGDTRWGVRAELGEDVIYWKEEDGGPHNGSYALATTTETVNLAELTDLPEANEDGSYVIEYRLIWGPHVPFRYDNEAPRTLTLAGCDPTPGNPLDDLLGSSEESSNLFDFDLSFLRSLLSS